MKIWDEQWKIISHLIDAVIYSPYVGRSNRAALFIEFTRFAKKHVTRNYPQYLAGIVLTRNRLEILLKMGLETAVSPIVNFIKSLSSPVQILGLLIIVFIIRKLVQSKVRKPLPPPREKPLEPMKKRDFTTQELLEYDGVKQQRVLLSVNFKVFDVTRGKDFYGPGEFIE